MGKIKAILVDDHQLFRSGLKFILQDVEGIDVIAEASNGKEFLELLSHAKPDIVLMDINMPEMNGIEATEKALAIYPDLKILILSMFGDDDYYNTMIDLGVKGFILKDADNEELKTAINRIIDGNSYFSQELLIKLIKNKTTVDHNIQLTKRELEILELICKGLSTNEIADQLNISIRTVERHRSSLLLKTNSNNSIKLVIYAIKNNLVKI
jgi:DNA-binding NarL/FixJ family response regulator